jgi:EAL domain-containing protein (putative c-di-GMP-specific phosphodiesterase class I)
MADLASSTTIPAVRRLRLGAPAALAAALGRDGPIVARRAGPPALSSAAGLRRRPWLRRLRRALEEDLFVLHFQPIVSLADGRISHHEALLRLADGDELVLPGSFLPAAERHGLIAEIDRMVIARAVALLGGPLAAAGAASPPALAVNVSALSVAEDDMLPLLERCLSRNDVDPSRLTIEITETAAIPDMQRARRFCAGVRALGCAVALDDFGAGFGSFQYLKHLPFDLLKIDGEFIRCLPASRTDQLVVKALVGVVRGMGRRTIAEFAGDQPTLAMLASYGVDYAQGFAVGAPQAALPGVL